MTVFLKVANGVAIDAALAGQKWADVQPESWIEATGGAAIGWRWDGASWSAPASPTDAERAAPLVLRRTAFLIALDAALGLTSADPLIEDYVESAVLASSTLSAADQRAALTIFRGAGEFHRSDPDRPDLLEAVGAELGLTPATIDQLFLQAAGVA